MPFTPHSHLEREVSGQPDDWVAVVGRLPELAGALPAAGARVAVIGCCTSYFLAQAYAALRERARQGETDAFPASEHRLDRGYDLVLAITRSGTTTEVLDVLRRVRGSIPTTVVLGDLATDAPQAAQIPSRTRPRNAST